MEHAYFGDPQREQEIHRLLDEIQVPDESLSDVSSDIILGRSTYEPESQIYNRGGQSPGRHHEDFFENSINSTIAHTSPLSNLNLNEDSKIDSSLSQAFTPQQVSRMMDWSKNHITPAEGLFPQVSAPSMSIEGDMWESPQDTPQPTMILRSHSSVERSQNYSKKSLSNLPVLDLPTHEDKPSREVITFSPNNAEANWYFNPAQNSKRSSANQSLKFPKNSFSTELMQGSALLAHAANHHFPSEVSLSQLRDNAPIFDEIHRLKTELSNLKVAFRSEQSMHEETKKELFQCSNILQDFEIQKADLEDKNAELEERVKLMSTKMKSPESLEQLRGKSLEYARMEIKQLKGYLAEKEKKIEDFKHALSQKSNMENNSARDKEIDELTYEITRLKLVNTSQSKQIKELNEKFEKEWRSKDTTTGELKHVIESYENKLKKSIEAQGDMQKAIEEKTREIERLGKALRELKQSLDSTNKDKADYLEELNKAKETIEVLQKQLSGTYYEKTSSADYDFQINKLRGFYEKKLEDLKAELSQNKSQCSAYENKIKSQEVQISKLLNNPQHSSDDEDKETIDVLNEALNNLNKEYQKILGVNNELKTTQRKYNEQLTALSNAKAKVEEELELKDNELNEQIHMLDSLRAEFSKNMRIYEIESQNSKDLIKQYEEEMDKLRFAKKQSEQLTEVLKRQLDDLKNNENTYKLKLREEVDQDVVKLKNSLQAITAKGQFEKDELYQRLREKDQEILEIKQELEESYKINEDKVRMDMEYFKETIEKEKEDEIKRIKKLYSNQSATQTSLDSNLREELKTQLREEIKTQIEGEISQKYLRLSQQTEERIRKEFELKGNSSVEKDIERIKEELNGDYKKKLEILKADFAKNTSKMEQEFFNKVKSIEANYETTLKQNKIQSETIGKIEELEFVIKKKEEEIKGLNRKCRDLELQFIEIRKNESLKPLPVVASQEELDTILKKVKDDFKVSTEKEKKEIISRLESEKSEILAVKDKLANDLKKKEDVIEELKAKEKKLLLDFEEKLEDIEIKHSQELEDYKAAYTKDAKDSDRNYYLKEKKLEKEFNDKIQELNVEFNEKLMIEQEKYKEMMSKKDILSKADNQRVKEEVQALIAEKEKEMGEQASKKLKTLKAQSEKDLKSKELEIEMLKETFELEKRKLREELTERINALKQENSKIKRDSERELKKAKEQAESASEAAKKEAELIHIEGLNKEKAEWDRKDKNKLKLLQAKHLKELSDKEQLARSEAEIDKNLALQEMAETYKQKIKQIQEDQKKYYEELKQTAVEEKSHEIELKVRRDLQENYLKTISQMDSQHFQEKEKMREEFRNELAKRIEEIRSYSYGDNEISYFDLPYSNKKSRVSDSQDLKAQLEIYKQRVEQMELDKESERFTSLGDVEKVKSIEYNKIVLFLQEEISCYLKKTALKAKGIYPEISGVLRGLFNKIDLEFELLKEKTRQEVSLEMLRSSGENKRKTIGQGLLNIEIEDTYFLKLHDKLYISLEKAIEDLTRLFKLFAERTHSLPIDSQSKTLKEDYLLQVSAFYRMICQIPEEKFTQSDEKERLKRYENDLKTLTSEYKAYVLKSKEWLEQNNKKKEDWAQEKLRYEEQIQILAEKIENLQDSNPISPEMLSPEETSSLVLGIFKRSGQDSLVLRLLQQNPEFIATIQHLVGNESPRIPSRPSIMSVRSNSRPKSVDVELAPMPRRPPQHSLKYELPVSISQNYHVEGFTFPYDN